MRDWTEVVELSLQTLERFNSYNLSAPGRSLYLLADNLVIMAVMERSQTADPHGGYTHVGYIKLPDIRERDRTAAKSLIRFPVTELTENNNPPKILGGFVKDEQFYIVYRLPFSQTKIAKQDYLSRQYETRLLIVDIRDRKLPQKVNEMVLW